MIRPTFPARCPFDRQMLISKISQIVKRVCIARFEHDQAEKKQARVYTILPHKQTDKAAYAHFVPHGMERLLSQLRRTKQEASVKEQQPIREAASERNKPAKRRSDSPPSEPPAAKKLDQKASSSAAQAPDKAIPSGSTADSNKKRRSDGSPATTSTRTKKPENRTTALAARLRALRSVRAARPKPRASPQATLYGRKNPKMLSELNKYFILDKRASNMNCK